MTKPITSVAAMMLYEEGAFELKDPVSKFIPSFADARVLPQRFGVQAGHRAADRAGADVAPAHPHLRADLRLPSPARHRCAVPDRPASSGVRRRASISSSVVMRGPALPLAFQPGTEWNYGVSTDVLGRVVEVDLGPAARRVLPERIFAPFGMNETGFFVAPETGSSGRPSVRPASHRPARRSSARSNMSPPSPPATLSGGGGLWGTADDYLRFCHLMLGRGELDGVRLLGSRTVDYMTRNHLPGGADLEIVRAPAVRRDDRSTESGSVSGSRSSSTRPPIGYSARRTSTPGAAPPARRSSATRCEDIAVVFLTQLLPSSTHPIRTQLKQLVYQAFVD